MNPSLQILAKFKTMQKLIYILMCTLLLAGCENKDLLQSDKKIRQQLEANTWKRIAPSSQDYHELWTFKDGKTNITWDKYKNGTIDTTVIYKGMYSVSTKTSSSYVSISGMPLTNLTGFERIDLNLKWTIAEINGNVLYLSAATETGTVKSLEYIKN